MNNSMINFTYIEHKDIECDMICEIIRLKTQYWQYNFDSQINWINENVLPNDVHLLMHKAGVLVGYLTIVNVEVLNNEEVVQLLGIGSVCIDIHLRGKGFGKKLVEAAVQKIEQNKKVGILLCSQTLIPFYEKCGLNLTKCKKVVTISKALDCAVLVCNETEDLFNKKTLLISKFF